MPRKKAEKKKTEPKKRFTNFAKAHAQKVIDTFTDQELEFINGSSLFSKPEFSNVLYEHGQPIAFIEGASCGGAFFVNVGVNQEFRGKGYILSMFESLVSYCRNNKIRIITWSCHKENIASIRAAEKLMFERVCDSDYVVLEYDLGKQDKSGVR